MDLDHKMKLKVKKPIIASMVILNMSVSFANDYTYIVKKDDTLTSVLYAKNLRPIYGKNGSLAKTLKLNPKIQVNRGNKIYPKMEIILADVKVASDKVKPTANDQKNDQSVKQEASPSESIAASNESPLIEQVTSDYKSSNDFGQSFYWNISPTLSWKNISSTDENVYRTSQIDALSNMNYGIGFTYGMHFEENIDVYSKLALEVVTFIEDNSIHLEKKNFLTSRFNMGIQYNQNWTLEVGMNDEFFLTSPATNKVEVVRVSLPEFKVGYQKDFYQYKNAKLGYLLSGAAALPRSTPQIDSKLSFGFGAGIEAKLKNQSFIIGYDLKLLKASGNSTDNHSIYWNYIWKTL